MSREGEGEIKSAKVLLIDGMSKDERKAVALYTWYLVLVGCTDDENTMSKIVGPGFFLAGDDIAVLRRSIQRRSRQGFLCVGPV